MNQTLADYGRAYLKQLLAQCTEPQQMLFKRMYSHGNLDLNINEAVDNMDETKIDWAITQCEKTVNNNQSKTDPATDTGIK